MIVLDTSTVLFWTQNRTLLSMPALAAIQEAGSLAIATISLWEIGWKQRMGKLHLPINAAELYERLRLVDRVTFLPTTADIWLTTATLNWHHRDPADRIIVATARLHSCPLVTSDETIRHFYEGAVW
ncbi:MAG: type II toxin-antitoxin system VapC family toxin [Caldilineaceae bacterium]|nr:type II toxin-antitoxin system VapC family toxin [Caldilineaceae bacterium]HRJ44014.1 type II toxin-antitoxin system VapC family toxin [Caldilineaceae bacterium]